jgi:hypothetical protein
VIEIVAIGPGKLAGLCAVVQNGAIDVQELWSDFAEPQVVAFQNVGNLQH